jgi:large subunit ribosomal protein L29
MRTVAKSQGTAEFGQMTVEELQRAAKEKRADLFELRRQLVMQRLDNNQRIKQTKRELARLLTIIRQKETAQ